MNGIITFATSSFIKSKVMLDLGEFLKKKS